MVEEQRSISLGSTLTELASLPAKISEILRVVQLVLRRQETQMALADDQRAALDDLKAEDGVVISALNDLLSKANASPTGTVSDADVQASIDGIRAEIDRVHAAVTADDPSVIPAPPAPPAPAGP
jgi:hypothetical protein